MGRGDFLTVPPGFRVAIDGPAGAGKSTLARRLATALALPYVNTGLMYRALARRALELGVDPDDQDALASLAEGMTFTLGSTQDVPELRIDGEPADPGLAGPDVEAIVSAVAAHPRVRAILRDRQRELGSPGAVMEGRDIGSVVLPDADVKIYLDAAPAVRMGRRRRERTEEGREPDVAETVLGRDDVDARTNPLEPAPDAVVLESSSLSRDDVFDHAMALLTERVGSPVSVEARLGPTTVAVVGRQNVGKSTLVNRFAGRKLAIADETPGVTRDRLEVPVRWGRTTFVAVDTGGFTVRPRGIESAVTRQADRATAGADLILLVVDAQTGVQEEDVMVARRLRRVEVPVILVANKVDSDRLEAAAGEFMKLGLGEAMPVSALHGRGSAELMDRILELLPDREAGPLVEGELRFAVVGRPNVGKSSIFNRVIEDERAVVHETAGTTRDAIDSTLTFGDRTLRFIDTAGLRRQVKTKGVEYYGLLRSLRALESAHVALLVVDASFGLTSEDKRVAARVLEAGKGLVVVLNKWDLVPSEERADLFVSLGRELSMFPGTPVLRTSALTGSGVKRIVPALLAVHAAWARRVPTGEVNRELEAAMAAYPPPRGLGRIRYATQVGAGPPTFVLFGSATVPVASYRRYLENVLRRAFGFDGVPIRLSFRLKHGASKPQPRSTPSAMGSDGRTRRSKGRPTGRAHEGPAEATGYNR